MHTLKDMVRDMTLGGKLQSPLMTDSMANLTKLFQHLFPYATKEDVEMRPQHVIDDIPEAYDEEGPNRHTIGMLYYYEFFVGHSTPYSKVCRSQLRDEVLLMLAGLLPNGLVWQG